MIRRITQSYDKIRRLPGHMIAKQALFSIKRAIRGRYYQIRDGCLSSQPVKIRPLKLCPLTFDWERLDCSRFADETVKNLTQMYMEHRFDLLGSGWIKNGFYNNAPGLEGYRYEALEIPDFHEGWLSALLLKCDVDRAERYSRLISPEYVPIDWQKDCKTGYRWDARQWYRPVELARLAGADIKMPWELSRLEHLPRLAIFAFLNPAARNQMKQEFVDECMDFMRQNPVRRGVNWMCTMDVGIRTANIALAYSLFRALEGFQFADDVEHMLTEIIFIHCKHIYQNLEWSALLCSNHYLANICGLLYGAALLPPGYRREKWLAFARKEYRQELLNQFYEEGSNFEGSVGYHRLSGEMAVFTGALIEALSGSGALQGLNREERSRIRKIGRFAADTMNPDGDFVQIGDNDSGRFFTLTPAGSLKKVEDAVNEYISLSGYPYQQDEMYWDEKVNSPEQLISAVAAFEQMGSKPVFCPFTYSLVRNMIESAHSAEASGRDDDSYDPVRHLNNYDHEQEILRYQNKWYIGSNGYCYENGDILNQGNKVDLTEDLEYVGYHRFGIHIYRSRYLYLCINATDNGQGGNGGHAHNDKLSFELWIDGQAVFQDPGTYVYTPLLQERNRYRSTKAHNCIQSGIEQNRFINTFAMSDDTRCELLELKQQKIVLQVIFGEIKQRRSFVIEKEKITIIDESNRTFRCRSDDVAISGGYGKLIRGKS